MYIMGRQGPAVNRPGGKEAGEKGREKGKGAGACRGGRSAAGQSIPPGKSAPDKNIPGESIPGQTMENVEIFHAALRAGGWGRYNVRL